VQARLTGARSVKENQESRVAAPSYFTFGQIIDCRWSSLEGDVFAPSARY